MPGRLTLPYRVYAMLANAALPLAYAKVARRLQVQGIAADRARERLGHPGLPRPPGPLIWCHAASVGESVSLLALIGQLLADDPALQVLVTTGTAASAQVLAARLPGRALHQFAPLDAKAPLQRFLTHWQPGLAVLVESELWPQLIVQTHAAGIPLALLNARLSAGSLRNWGRVPGTARALLQRIALIRTQTAATAQALRALGADPATTGVMGNLKATAQPLPVDLAALEQCRAGLNHRPVWAAASTHPGEEELILWAHKAASKVIPGLTLILIPRHADRGDAVEKLCHAAGFATARRSMGQRLTHATTVYLADTLGETGLWFALAPLVFLGGSLVPVGGHNPYEPALAGAALLHGPHVGSATEAYAGFTAAGAAIGVPDAASLARRVVALLTGPAELQAMQQAASTWARSQPADLTDLAATLHRLMR